MQIISYSNKKSLKIKSEILKNPKNSTQIKKYINSYRGRWFYASNSQEIQRF